MLSKEGLYKLDADQDIWEDLWGDMADFPGGILPQWLVDPTVKQGMCVAQWLTVNRSWKGVRWSTVIFGHGSVKTTQQSRDQ